MKIIILNSLCIQKTILVPRGCQGAHVLGSLIGHALVEVMVFSLAAYLIDAIANKIFSVEIANDQPKSAG